MAIIEVNLEKPALVEEYQFPKDSAVGSAVESETPASESRASESDESESSGGVKGKLLGLLAVAAGVGLLVWKLKSRGGDEQTDFDEFETDDESETDESPEWEIEEDGGSSKGKVAGLLGLVVAAVGLLVAVQKRRN